MSDSKKNGFVLPSVLMLGIMGSVLILSTFSLAKSREMNLAVRIATYKAKLNAESGLARGLHMVSKDSLENMVTIIDPNGDTLTVNATSLKNPVEISENSDINQGTFKDVRIESKSNNVTRIKERSVYSYGVATYYSVGNVEKEILDSAYMDYQTEPLSKFMYLTAHEHAGGAPGIFNGNASHSNGLSTNQNGRSKPCFGPDDVLGNATEIAGFVQTNDPMYICSSTDYPTFENIVRISKATEQWIPTDFNTLTGMDINDPIFPQNGPAVQNMFTSRQIDCNGNGQTGDWSDCGYTEEDPACFDLNIRDALNSNLLHEFDSTELLNLSRSKNFTNDVDRLIMTEIEFEPGGYRVTRWWYYMPPYFKSTAGNGVVDPNELGVDTPLDYAMPSPDALEGMPTGSAAQFCSNTANITTCDQYRIALMDFHGKRVTSDGQNFTSFYEETYMLTENNNNTTSNMPDPNTTNDIMFSGSAASTFPSNAIDGYPEIENNGSIQRPVDDDWSGGSPGDNFFPTQPDWDITKVDPNGYGSTNLSHYDPENFRSYFDDQMDDFAGNNGDWSDATYEFSQEVTTTLPNGGIRGTRIDSEFFANEKAVIHIRGGPVRVKGNYSGAYTILTTGHDAVGDNPRAQREGWSTYYRNAFPFLMGGSDFNQQTGQEWGAMQSPPVDTIFTNIWIVDDIINSESAREHCPSSFAESPNYNDYNSAVCPPQPNFDQDNDGENDCSYDVPGDCGGSPYVLGLLSSANVVVANTQANRNHVNIHASIIALHESFVMHYWQNSNNPAGIFDSWYWAGPPLSDRRGRKLFPTGSIDNGATRGFNFVYGGIIQAYRGYMKRGGGFNNYPYNGSNIGMDKRYNFDNNLYFPPPDFPELNTNCNDETTDITLMRYGKIN